MLSLIRFLISSKAKDIPTPIQFGNVSFDHEKILEGVVSDNVCVSNPCNHNGSCHVTWNDFWCRCPRGYTGKTCQEMEFCQLQDCPAGSRCQNLDDGYECIANATFDGVATAFAYKYGRAGNEHRNASDSTLNTIEITYRSNTGGTLLDISMPVGSHFTVSVLKDEVTVSWLLDSKMQSTMFFGKTQPDGNWTSLLIKLYNNSLECSYVDSVIEDHMSYINPNFSFPLWYDLLVMGTVTLGGLSNALSNRHSYVTVGATHEKRDLEVEGNTVEYNEHMLTTAIPPNDVIAGGCSISIVSVLINVLDRYL